MKACVVDSSVVAAALFDEEHASSARCVLVEQELHAPDLIYAELGNVIWKRFGRGEIDEAEALELVKDVMRVPLVVTASARLLEAATALAMRTGRTVYDSLYLALAVESKTEMRTADRRLVNAIAGGPLAKHVRWIGDKA